nr:unnamed protein product [Callosobruchus chinensis]
MFVHLCTAHVSAGKCGLECYQNKQFVTFGSYCR